jgi:Mrp family chromosome partitioning ATPase
MVPERERRNILESAIERVQGVADTVQARLSRIADASGRTCILFTSAEPKAGTTLMAASTAMALARNLRIPVHLVEANVERPTLASFFDLPGAPGLSDLLDGRCTVEDCRQLVHTTRGLTITGGGKARRSIPGELADEAGMSALDGLLSQGKLVIIDCPPLFAHAYARPLLARADGVVLILRARSTPRAAAEQTVKMLEESGVPILGSLLNRFKSDMPFGLGDREWL